MGIAFAIVGSVACDTPTSATDLYTKGPPKIRQIRMTETYDAGAGQLSTRKVFAFGTHPQADATTVHPVTAGTPLNNQFRIIMSELLRGNRLEEIQCRYVVDDDAYQAVPDGTNPDDISRCAQAQDLLPSVCPGSNPHSVCICQKDTGCLTGTDENGMPLMTPQGESVGVADVNQDGAVDDTRLIAGAVGVACGAITVPINQDKSYWNPSGNQQVPAQGGFDALGPAIVLVPAAALPTNLDCTIVFDANVVDKDDNLPVCAPPDGDVTVGCDGGDTSLTKFRTEALQFSTVQPVDMTGVSRTDDVVIHPNSTIDVASLANITIIEGAATNFTAFTVSISVANNIVIHPTAATGFAANTMYKVTIPITVTDTYRQAAPAPFVLTFTTGA